MILMKVGIDNGFDLFILEKISQFLRRVGRAAVNQQAVHQRQTRWQPGMNSGYRQSFI